jgi:hypothetical protein
LQEGFAEIKKYQTMKEYKVLYLKQRETPDNPDEGYRKLYPKEDGWFMLDSEGNEIKIEGLLIIDLDDEILPQKEFLQFMWPFRAREDGDRIVVELEGLDGDGEGGLWLVHGNELHDPAFATEEDLQAHLDDEEPHGIILDWIHEQNTDTCLAQGTEDEICAEELRAMADQIIIGGPLKTASHTVNVDREHDTYIADCTDNHVKFVVPPAETHKGIKYTFRHGCGTYAMTVERSVEDIIEVNCEEWEGLTTDEPGTWYTIQSDGERWYLIADSWVDESHDISQEA